MLKKNGDDDEENISSSQKKTITISSSTIFSCSCSCSSLFPRLPPAEQSNIITYQPASQTTNQPTNQPTDQPANHPTTQPTNHQTKPILDKRKKGRKKKHSIHMEEKQTKPNLFSQGFSFSKLLARSRNEQKTFSEKETLKKNSTWKAANG